MGGVAALAREAGHRVTGCDTGVYPPMSDQLRALGIELVEGLRRRPDGFQPDVWVIGNVVSRARLPDGTARYPLMEAILDSGACATPAARSGWPNTCCRAATCWPLPAPTARPPPPRCWRGSWSHRPPARLPGGRRAGRFRRLGPARHGPAVRDRGRRIRHGVLRQAQQVRPLPPAHRDPEQPGVRPRRHLRRPRRDRAPVPPPGAHRAGVGTVVVNGLEESLTRVLHQGCWSEVRSFGAAVSDFTAEGEPGAFDVLAGPPRGPVDWELSGTHNQLNALAAIAAAEHVGVAPPTPPGRWRIPQRQAAHGTARRGRRRPVYDDFAHHPTAIRTTLDGLRRKLGPGAAASWRCSSRAATR
jgi:UDP-N-acetylmuramate: L-alanyl-gamma-D-glutamyl-meso-diaminopimelate ligase